VGSIPTAGIWSGSDRRRQNPLNSRISVSGVCQIEDVDGTRDSVHFACLVSQITKTVVDFRVLRK
jgi:hypothetical protein